MGQAIQTDQADAGELRFRKLIEHSYAGITLLDRDLRVVYRSPAAEHITGWSTASRAEQSAAALIHPDDVALVQQLLLKVNTLPGQPVRSRFRTRHYDGHYFWIECTLTNLLDEPEVGAIVFNFVDISRQVELEEEQRRNQALVAENAAFVRAVTDHLPAMMAYFSADLRCRFANKPYQEYFGAGAEVTGKLKSELLSATEYRDHEKHLKAVLKGERQSFERTLPAADGTFIYTHTQYLPDGPPGAVRGFYSLIYDVSEVKAAENEASQKSEQLEELLGSITDGFIAADSEQRYTYVNKRLGEMVGLDTEEMIGKRIWDLFPAAVGSVTYRSIQEALQENRYVASEDYYAPLALWQENRIYPHAGGFSMFVQDITARKRSQEQLRQSNERFAMISKATRDALFEWDLTDHSIWWSESHYTMFGFDPAGPIPAQAEWLARLHPEGRLLFGRIVESVHCGELRQWEEEVGYRRPAGEWGVLLARGFIIFDQEQVPVKMLGSFIDITDRKKAEGQRELLAELTRPFHESSELKDILERASRVLIAYGGYSSVEYWLLSPTGHEIVYYSGFHEDGTTRCRADQDTLLKGQGLPGQAWANGELLQVQTGNSYALAVPLTDHDDFVAVIFLQYTAKGVNEQVQLPDGLAQQLGADIRHQQMAEQLRRLFDRAPDMIGIIGIDRYFKKVNPAMCTLLEYSEQELLNLHLDLLIHPADLENSRERTKAFIAGDDQLMYFENRFISKSGKAIWLAWTVTRSAGENVMFCIGKDVSDKKEMENLLRKANELARIGGWEVDRVNGTAYWSPITREIYEVPDTFVPDFQNWLSFYEEGANRDYIAGKMAYTIATGQPCDAEVEMITGRGKKRWVRAMADAEFRDGECIRVYGSFQDIDDRKKAELAAIAALQDRDQILESIGDGFFAVDHNWNVTYWNVAAEQMLGRSRESMLGKYLWGEYPEATELELHNQYKKAVHTGKAVHFEDFYPPMQHWFGLSAYPSTSGLSVFFKDITAHKQAVQALEESEKRYSDLFHLSPQPMFVYEMSTLRYLDVNLSAIEHYGFSREEFLAMTILDIRPPEDVPLLKKTVSEKAKETKVRLEGLFRHRKKDGTIIQVDIHSNIITFHGVNCKVILASDVTERLQYIEAIEQQNSKLKEISWMQSHVIRAPLSRMMGLIPMLETPAEATEQRLIHDYLVSTAQELDEVIRSITEVTSIVTIPKNL